MAWIESHDTLGRHPKLLRLAARLQITRPCAVGHLHFLWWWAQTYAADGDMTSFSVAEIANSAEWTADPTEFVNALIECGSPGFLEQLGDRLVIHDWQEYGGMYLKRREQSRERQRRYRERQTSDDVTRDSRVSNALVTHTGNAHVTHDRTGQDRTGQDRTGECASRTTRAREEQQSDSEKEAWLRAPLLVEVRSYFTASGRPELAEAFYNHYQAQGWVLGNKLPITDYQAAARQWIAAEDRRLTETPSKRLSATKQAIEQWKQEQARKEKQV